MKDMPVRTGRAAPLWKAKPSAFWLVAGQWGIGRRKVEWSLLRRPRRAIPRDETLRDGLEDGEPATTKAVGAAVSLSRARLALIETEPVTTLRKRMTSVPGAPPQSRRSRARQEGLHVCAKTRPNLMAYREANSDWNIVICWAPWVGSSVESTSRMIRRHA